MKKLIVGLAVALVLLVVAPDPASATPKELVSRAQYDAVRYGMTVAQVQTAIGGKRIYLWSERRESDGSIFRVFYRDVTVGSCRQVVTFGFSNRDSRSQLGPFTQRSKSYEEAGCVGVVK